MLHGHKDERTVDELARLGYERADIGLRTIAIWVFWFFVFTVAAGVATAAIYWFMVPSKFGPVQMEKRAHFPPAPRLQDEIRTKTDIIDLRKNEDEALSGSRGGVPIDEAMKQEARRLSNPSRQQTEETLERGQPQEGPTDIQGARQ